MSNEGFPGLLALVRGEAPNDLNSLDTIEYRWERAKSSCQLY